jgi:hypothetical protein
MTDRDEATQKVARGEKTTSGRKAIQNEKATHRDEEEGGRRKRKQEELKMVKLKEYR